MLVLLGALFTVLDFFTVVVILVSGAVVWALRAAFTPKFSALPSYDGGADDTPEKTEGLLTRARQFKQLIAANDINNGSSYKQSADVIRAVCKSGFFAVNDLMRKSAENLFIMHREFADEVEGGLGTRITVQYNLFGGSVANLGSAEQREWLVGVLARGELGCFLLTEQGAGVLSGLVVETTATWSKQGYTLHSPAPLDKSRKMWISQGLQARWGVVTARLILASGEDKGPHAFIIDLENTKGVHREDMPRKTEFNGLDNAYVWFDQSRLPLTSLLCGISQVGPEGEYVLNDPKVPFRFEDVAQRLLSGRICIAGASLARTRATIDAVEAYGRKSRDIPTGKNQTTPLADLPCMRDLMRDLRGVSRVFRRYVLNLERSFMNDVEITPALVNRIACAKVLCIEFAIRATTALKERVGSLSLFEHGPFGPRNDLLYVFRFAEGDSNVLQQKMVRDALRALQSMPRLAKHAAVTLPSTLLANRNGVGKQRFSAQLDLLRVALAMAGKSKAAMLPAWLEAHAMIERTARKLAILTVWDDVYAQMRGTKELELFRRRYLENFDAQ